MNDSEIEDLLRKHFNECEIDSMYDHVLDGVRGIIELDSSPEKKPAIVILKWLKNCSDSKKKKDSFERLVFCFRSIQSEQARQLMYEVVGAVVQSDTIRQYRNYQSHLAYFCQLFASFVEENRFQLSVKDICVVAIQFLKAIDQFRQPLVKGTKLLAVVEQEEWCRLFNVVGKMISIYPQMILELDAKYDPLYLSKIFAIEMKGRTPGDPIQQYRTLVEKRIAFFEYLAEHLCSPEISFMREMQGDCIPFINYCERNILLLLCADSRLAERAIDIPKLDDYLKKHVEALSTLADYPEAVEYVISTNHLMAPLLQEHLADSRPYWRFIRQACDVAQEAELSVKGFLKLFPLDKLGNGVFQLDPAAQQQLNIMREFIRQQYEVTLSDPMVRLIHEVFREYGAFFEEVAKEKYADILIRYRQEISKQLGLFFAVVVPFLANGEEFKEIIWVRLAYIADKFSTKNVSWISCFRLFQQVPYLLSLRDCQRSALDIIVESGLGHSDNKFFNLSEAAEIEDLALPEKAFQTGVAFLSDIEKQQHVANIRSYLRRKIGVGQFSVNDSCLTYLQPNVFHRLLNLIRRMNKRKQVDFIHQIGLHLRYRFLKPGKSINLKKSHRFFVRLQQRIDELNESPQSFFKITMRHLMKGFPLNFAELDCRPLLDYLEFFKMYDNDDHQCFFSDKDFQERNRNGELAWQLSLYRVRRFSEVGISLGRIFPESDQGKQVNFSLLYQHLRFLPFLLDANKKQVLQVILDFYRTTPYQYNSMHIEECGYSDYVGMIKFIYEYWPLLFSETYCEQLRCVLKSYHRFAQSYQQHFQPISPFYSQSFYPNEKDLSVLEKNCREDYECLVRDEVLTPEGKITGFFQRGITLNVPSRKGVNRFDLLILQQALVEGLGCYNRVLPEFSKVIEHMCQSVESMALQNFFNKFDTVIQCLGENRSIQSDLPCVTEKELDEVDGLKNCGGKLIALLKQYKFLDQTGKIINKDWHYLQALLRVKSNYSNLSLELIEFLRNKIFLHSPFQQLFVFAPRMNALWSNWLEYFDLLIATLPRIQSIEKLHQFYLLLQVVDDVQQVPLLLFGNTVEQALNWEDFIKGSEEQQLHWLTRARLFRMRAYRAIGYKILEQEKLNNACILMATIKTIAAIGVDLPNNNGHSSGLLFSLLLDLLKTRESLEFRTVAITALSRLNLDPSNPTLRQAFQQYYFQITEEKSQHEFILALLKALHLLEFQPVEDRKFLLHLSKAIFENPMLAIELAILQSDQPDLACLIAAWRYINSDNWPYPARLSEETEGFEGEFIQYCRRPTALERSKHHMLWKIKGNLLHYAECHDPDLQHQERQLSAASGQQTRSVLPENKELEFFRDYFKGIPTCMRFNLIPFRYPDNSVLFRGIGPADGEGQVFVALMDLFLQGSGSTEITNTNPFGQTNSKQEMIFTTASLKVATSPYYFSTTNGFLLVIDAAYFNRMMLKGEYRVEREGEYNAVFYHRIPPHALIKIFLPHRYKADLDLLAGKSSLEESALKFSSKEFKQLNYPQMLECRRALNVLYPEYCFSQKTIRLFDKVCFLPAEDDLVLARNLIHHGLPVEKRIIAETYEIEEFDDLEKLRLPAALQFQAITTYLDNAENVWDSYATKFDYPDYVNTMRVSSDDALGKCFSQITPYFPKKLRQLIYIQDCFTKDQKLVSLLDVLNHRNPSLWRTLYEVFGATNQTDCLRTDHYNENRFVMRMASVFFLQFLADYKQVLEARVYTPSFFSHNEYCFLFEDSFSDSLSYLQKAFCMKDDEFDLTCNLTRAVVLLYLNIDVKRTVTGYRAFLETNFNDSKRAEEMVSAIFHATCKKENSRMVFMRTGLSA